MLTGGALNGSMCTLHTAMGGANVCCWSLASVLALKYLSKVITLAFVAAIAVCAVMALQEVVLDAIWVVSTALSGQDLVRRLAYPHATQMPKYASKVLNLARRLLSICIDDVAEPWRRDKETRERFCFGLGFQFNHSCGPKAFR